MSFTWLIGDIELYSSGSSRWLTPSRAEHRAMSDVNSSVIMLFTARSVQIARNRSLNRPASVVAMYPP